MCLCINFMQSGCVMCFEGEVVVGCASMCVSMLRYTGEVLPNFTLNICGICVGVWRR